MKGFDIPARGSRAAINRGNKMEKERDRLDLPFDSLRRSVTTADQVAKVFDRTLRELIRPHHESLFWGDRLLTLDKAAGFRDDEVFRASLHRADSSTGANQYESPDGISWRYHTLIWAARSCLSVRGDYVECGVYRGDMTWMVTENVNILSAGKRFFLYDTFSGLDPRFSSEADFPDAPHLYALANKQYKAPGIEQHVRQRFRDKEYIVVTKGVVPEVLDQTAPDQIAFLHLDLNSPRAESGALEVLFDRISTGGIVIFDDYGWKIFRKQKEAADAFMTARGQIILEMPTGQGVAIKR
jgi:O-methyltransferase